MKTSLGIWALGPMVTRFVPGGYQPEHLTETMPAYAGSYLHRWDSPVHTHSFVEIAFAVGGTATHHSLVGRREMQPGEVLLLSERLMNRDAGGCVDASGWSWRVVLRKWQTRAP